jgi:hypothetical protein
MWKKIKLYTVLTVIAALCLTAYYYRWQATQGRGVVVRTLDKAAVVQQIQQLSELVTVRYRIQKVIGLKEEKIPFGSESVLLLVQAEVLGGVDLSDLTPAHVTITGTNALALRLPAAKVLHVFINDKETQVWDRSKTWWTPWVALNPQLEQQARQAALDSVQQAALDMGLLTNAQQQAATTLRRFLAACGYRQVDVTCAPPVRQL